MLKHAWRALAATVLVALSVIWAPAIAAAGPTTQGTVLFVDNFDGLKGSYPSTSRWEDYSSCTHTPAAAFGKIKCGNNEVLDGWGKLIIPATPAAGSGIRTKVEYQYGTFSVWARMPAQDGYWPAFWTLNSKRDGSSPPATTTAPSGEVDITEVYTTADDDGYHALAHVWTGDSTTKYGSGDQVCARGADLTGKYNKYSATISPGKVEWFFNDVSCGKTFVKDPAKPWGFGPTIARPNWLILNLAVGGGGQAAATQNATLLVTKVEIRALPGG